MKETPSFFFEIVYLRAFAVLAVISIHISEYLTDMNQITFLTFLYMSIDTFSHFAVPLFVCISGFVLYNNYKGAFSSSLFYKRRLTSVVPQYIIFSVSGILLAYLGLHFLRGVRSPDIENIVYLYSIGEHIFFLWFFLLIIELYILYPLIERIFTKFNENNKIFEFLLLLLIIQIVWQIFLFSKLYLIGSATVFLGFLFYFVFGMVVRSRYHYVKRMMMNGTNPIPVFLCLLILTVLGVAVYDIKYFNPDLFPQFTPVIYVISAVITPFYYIIIFALCLFIALRMLEHSENNATTSLQVIGKYSFGIYLVHGFILFVLVSIVFPAIGFSVNNWLFYPVVFILTLSVSMCAIYTILKIPYHEYIIGDPR